MVESESKYKAALEAIASGTSWESYVANSALEQKRGWIRKTLGFLGENLAPIATVFVAASGLLFGYIQWSSSRSQKEIELRMAKVETLQKLIPSLTSTAADQRRYALVALVQLEKTFDRPELLDLAASVEQIGDPETVGSVAKAANDANVNKEAAELYALRSQTTRHGATSPESEWEKRNRLVLADAQEALWFDYNNARALYQVAVVQKENRDYVNPITEFNRVIKLIDDKTYSKDDNHDLYLRSYLNQVECLYNQDGRISDRVCKAYQTAKAKYQGYGLEQDIKKELATYEAACH